MGSDAIRNLEGNIVYRRFSKSVRVFVQGGISIYFFFGILSTRIGSNQDRKPSGPSSFRVVWFLFDGHDSRATRSVSLVCHLTCSLRWLRVLPYEIGDAFATKVSDFQLSSIMRCSVSDRERRSIRRNSTDSIRKPILKVAPWMVADSSRLKFLRNPLNANCFLR